MLLDEIEKAHPEAFNMLLQIMEDGSLADAKGRRVDFRNALLIMTSNVGAKLIQGSKGIGFAITADEQTRMEAEYEQMKSTRVMDALKKTFRPEFINRLDGIMVFRSLTKEEITEIVELELRTLRAQLDEQEMKLELTPAARYAIADAGYNPDYGARPLRRVIQSEVQDPLSEALLEGRFIPGDTIQVDFIPNAPAGPGAEHAAGERMSGSRNPFDSTNGAADDEGPKGAYEFTAIAHRAREEEEPEDSEATEELEALLQ